MPALLASGHLADTTPYDVLAWTALALVVIRIGRTGDCRWWLAAGLILGLGLANKRSAGLFAAALVAGALLSGGRAMLLNRWFLVGAAIAVAFTVPDLWWQAQHHWATIAMTQTLNRKNGGLGHVGTWVIGQVIMVTLALVWVWLAGLRFLWRSGRPLWRALTWAYGLLFVLFAVTTGAKIYYLAGTYPYLLAAGFVSVDGWLAARPGRVRNLMLATALTTAAALPIVLPVLPGRGRRLDLHGERGQRRVHRLAPVGPDRAEGLDVPAARPARARRDLHGQLRRGRRDQRTGPGGRPAHGRQRAQHRMVVGTGQPARHHGGRGRARRRPPLPSLPVTVLHQRAAGGHAVQPGRDPQPGMGRPRLPLHRAGVPLGPAVAAAASLQLTTARVTAGIMELAARVRRHAGAVANCVSDT